MSNSTASFDNSQIVVIITSTLTLILNIFLALKIFQFESSCCKGCWWIKSSVEVQSSQSNQAAFPQITKSTESEEKNSEESTPISTQKELTDFLEQINKK